jgi:hypothetical protein
VYTTGETLASLLHEATVKLREGHAQEVTRIMVAEVAATVSGSTPRCNIRGPLTIPPPTPNMPAIRPANEHITGNVTVVRGVHAMSPLSRIRPTCTQCPQGCILLNRGTRVDAQYMLLFLPPVTRHLVTGNPHHTCQHSGQQMSTLLGMRLSCGAVSRVTLSRTKPACKPCPHSM